MTDPAPDRDATYLANAVGGLLDPVFVALESLADDILACRQNGGRNLFTERSLAPLEGPASAHLRSQPTLAGLGYVAAPDVVAGQERYLMWWQRSGDDLARLRLNFDPSSVDVYDYLQMTWYADARDRGGRAAFGPYVDYTGSGLYVVTASVPVVADGFLGVAGGDIVMARLERSLVSVLRTSPFEALVVGGERRVLAANSARWVVGTRLREAPVAGEAGVTEVVEVTDGPGWWVVLTDAPRQV